jgi:hypothetical protein
MVAELVSLTQQEHGAKGHGGSRWGWGSE